MFSMISDPADYLFCASIWGFEDILQTRLDGDPMGLNPYAVFRYNRALHLACMYGNIREAEVLLEVGARLDEQMMEK